MYPFTHTLHLYISFYYYKLYWVWSQQYNPQSRILLIDAKDTYFQPFSETGIGTGRKCKESAPSTLHLYEENKKVVKLGSLPNRAQLIEGTVTHHGRCYLNIIRILIHNNIIDT